MDTPLISVIIPVYNKEKTIEKCVDSVLRQQHPNIEIILVDDGSQDSSYELCVRLSNTHSNVTVLHQENKGVSAARNIGLKYATGEYISFVDSDDWIHESMLSLLISCLMIFAFFRKSEEYIGLKNRIMRLIKK